jgi:hypothetical protein
MAKGTKFTVTHPDGSVSTRTSKTMTYTHAILEHTDHDTTVAELRKRQRSNDLYGGGKGHDEYEAAIAAVGPDGAYGIVGWSQSAHNAEKAAASWAKHSAGIVTVVEVDA